MKDIGVQSVADLLKSDVMSGQGWRTAYGGGGVNVPGTREMDLKRLDTPATDEELGLDNALVPNRKEMRSSAWEDFN